MLIAKYILSSTSHRRLSFYSITGAKGKHQYFQTIIYTSLKKLRLFDPIKIGKISNFMHVECVVRRYTFGNTTLTLYDVLDFQKNSITYFRIKSFFQNTLKIFTIFKINS